MLDETDTLIKEKNLTKYDIYWLEMEQDSYKEDKEKFDAIQKTIDRLKDKEETVTIKLSLYHSIISNLDKARREADFYKAQYEALKTF